MSRSLSAAVLALSLALPSAAGAIPPPPPVAVVVVDAGAGLEASEELLASVGGGAWFQTAEAPVAAAAFAACADIAEAEACVRGVLAEVEQDRPPVVVVLAAPGRSGSLAWTCVGPGEAATQPERQSAGFDPLRWDNATDRYWNEDRAAAAGCVLAAASESGW